MKEGENKEDFEVNSSFGLSKREREVLKSVCFGKTNIEIAKELTLSDSVVELHLTNIYKKLGAKNRAHAVYIVCKPDN